MSPIELNTEDECPSGSSNISSSNKEENGFVSSLPVFDPENVVKELLQPPVRTVDDHLVEFSEAMRTVAKALRHVAEGKAAAMAEAAEWKRRYELEREHNLQGKNKVERWKSCDKLMHDESNDESETCCGEDGICSHEVLQDVEEDSDIMLVPKRVTKKASFKLCWGCNSETNGQHNHDIVSFEKGDISTAIRSRKQITLKWESRPQTVLIFSKPNSNSVRGLCREMVRWLRDSRNIDVFVEPRVKLELLSESSYFDFVNSWNDDEEISRLHTKVDLVVTLGGDGTVLWAASMFKGPVPPIVSFSLGSLGFMTPFQSDHYKDHMDSIFRGPISITLRHRLQCYVIRESAKDELETEEPILVLNEVTIDRGISSFLTYLECYCDNSFVTSVQGDGLILSTTSGSTAYSLAAGGSMVHPQVPGILFTPICPHSLSFRPLILPEYATLRVQVPFNSRGHAWASFDGKDRKELVAGDALICRVAPWPVPTACQNDSTIDFLHSIHEGLHWNLRKSQSFDGPRDTS